MNWTELGLLVGKFEDLYSRISNKDRLEVGDPFMREYVKLCYELNWYLPPNWEASIDFLTSLKEQHEELLAGVEEEVRGELEPKIKELEEKMKLIADAVRPHLDK